MLAALRDALGRAAAVSGLRSETLHVPGLVLVEHELDVPLDHAAPDAGTITVFAREVADPAGRDRPFLVYLQGGPGQEAPRPTRQPTGPAWLDRALQDFRVLMVDQRGTGRSTPVGVLPGMTPQQQADHLALFRADAIVQDCELLREALGVDTWSVLGQSFGGFCALQLPLGRAGQPARGAVHRRRAPGGRGRSTTSTPRRTPPCASATRATTAPTPPTGPGSRPCSTAARPARWCCPTAT